MSKKFFSLIIFFACIAKGSAQVEVHTSNQVGIGTTNPQYKLHVIGDAFVTGNLLIGTASNFLGTTGNYPIIFKTNNVLSGSTGSSTNTNISFGYEALLNPQSAYENTAVGYGALRFANGVNNIYSIAIGTYALYSATESNRNTATGAYALYSNMIGQSNCAFGTNALYSNTTGAQNDAFGANA